LGWYAPHPRYDAWAHHQAAVQHLDSEIGHEQRVLHRLHSMEREMTLRHGAIKHEMHSLVKASSKMADELDRVRGTYGGQIARFKDEYHDVASKLKEQREAAEEEMRENDAEEKELRERVASTRASAAQNREEAKHLFDDVSAKRERAAKEEKNSEYSIGMADRHYKMRVQQQARQADALSEVVGANTRAAAMPKVTHIQTHTAHWIGRVEAHTAKVEGHAGQQKAIKHAAEVAADDAKTLGEEVEMRTRHLKKKLEKEENEVLDARGKEAMAQARAVKYINRMHAARHHYFTVMHDEAVARARTAAAQKIIDSATAKETVADAARRMADVVAEGDKGVAKRAKDRARIDEQDGNRIIRLNNARARADEMRREETLEEALASYRTQLDAEGLAHEEYGRAHLHNTVSDHLMEASSKRVDRADRLLRQVTVAAGGALESADSAHQSMQAAQNAEGKLVE